MFAVIVLEMLLLVAVFVTVSVVSKRINRRISRWADAMICSFGLPGPEKVECADSTAKQPIVQTKSKFRFIPLIPRRLAKLATSLLS
jgi:hypothetical protein